MSGMKRKFTLQNALDDIAEIQNKLNDMTFNIHALYIEPPERDNDISGEDDDNEDEDGFPDNVCPAQLNAGCEVVLSNGRRISEVIENWEIWDPCDDGNGIVTTHIHDEELLSNLLKIPFVYEDVPVYEEDDDVPSSSAGPPAKRLRHVKLPRANKDTVFEWEEDESSALFSPFPPANYQDCNGLKAHEQFEKFFDDILLQHIADCSNIYADFRGRAYSHITGEEVRVVLGILIIMSYVNLPSFESYWASENDVHNKMVNDSMHCNRFEEILQNLHFEPRVGMPVNNTDKLWKLRPIIDHLKVKMLENFHPERNLAFDESIIVYYGRHGCKQYIKGKPLRFGYKVWSMCTPEGYLLNFDIYQGENSRSKTQYEERFGKCTASMINMIDEFPEDVKELPFSFYFDHLLSSFPLLAYLKLRGYNGTGTIHENRIPPSCPLHSRKHLAKKDRSHFETIKMKGTDIRVTKYVDSSVVSLVSSCHGVKPFVNAGRFDKKANKRVSFKCPYIVHEYNQYMSGVDRLDQNLSLYRIGYRGKKWWMSIFTWLIDVCVENAWILQRKHNPNISQLEFRREIATFYCKRFGITCKGLGRIASEKRRSEKNTLITQIRYDGKEHWVIPIEKKRRCAGDSCKSIIRTACDKCNVGLCLPCFKVYHAKPE